MPKLIVIRGNSGSGKSSAAAAVQKHFGRGCLRIPQDTVRRDMLLGKDTEALPLLETLVRFAHENCEIAVLEGILAAEVYAPLFQLINELYGKDVHAFYYDIPFEETLRRHDTRPQKTQFGEEAMRDWWIEKDYSPLLHETPITQEMSLEEAVELIVRSAEEKKS